MSCVFRPWILLVLVAGLMVGCLHNPGGIAPSNVPLAPGGYTVLGEADGTDCLWSLLGIIPISSGNTTRDALREALEDHSGADALINITSDSFFQHFILIARACTQVQGVAVSTGGGM